MNEIDKKFTFSCKVAVILILGLHNKPKAAVHSVHKLMGPKKKKKKKSSFSCQILIKTEFFLNRFSENTPVSAFTKIRRVGAKLSNVDGRDRQADTTKLTVASRNCPNAHKN
jgi:hypothetical protein